MAFRVLLKGLRRYYAPITVSVGSTAFAIAALVPECFTFSKRKSQALRSEDGTDIPLTQYVRDLTEMVLHDSKWAEGDETRLEFFNCTGFDPIHQGTVRLRTGAYVGLPHTFPYHTHADVDRKLFPMLVNNEYRSIDWDSTAGQSFLDSLVLSNQAKLFAIAREMYYAQSHYVALDSLLRILTVCGAYATGHFISNTLHLKGGPFLLRLGLYISMAALYTCTYFLLKDAYCCWRDTRVDKRAARIGQPYAQGGIEYYTKQLQRNMAIRTLMGPYGGKSLYTANGNEETFLRQPSVKFTTRLGTATTILEELKRNEAEGKQPFKQKKLIISNS